VKENGLVVENKREGNYVASESILYSATNSMEMGSRN